MIPRFLEDREIAHAGVDLRVVDSMHERKALMAELSDAFVALPGGFGTFEEFFEIVTWVQLQLVDAPCILANVDGYFDPLIALIDGATGKRVHHRTQPHDRRSLPDLRARPGKARPPL